LLGLSPALRIALELQRVGVSELAVFGPDADSLCAELRADARLSVPVTKLGEATPLQLVCFYDALVAPEWVRRLGVGEALADQRGAPAMALGDGVMGADPMQLLAAATVIDRGVLRLDHPDDRRRARRQLLDGLIKPSDGPVSRRLNRHVSRFITQLVLPLGMTPNVMTVFVALTGLADDTCNAAIFVGLSLGVARALSVSWPLLTAAFTAFAYVGVIALQYGVVLRTTGRGDKTKFWAPIAPGQWSVFGVFKALLRRDVFVLLIFIAVALHLAPAAVAVFPLSALGAFVASSLRLMQSRGAA
jgi:hypothetical protein